MKASTQSDHPHSGLGDKPDNLDESTSKLEKPLQEEPSMSEEIPAASQPTDFRQFALSQNFGVQANVIKRLTTVPVRKPGKTQWFRIHPDYKLDVWLLKYGENGEDFYLVKPSLVGELSDLAKPFRLFACIDRQGVIFIWPVRHPDVGRPMHWHLSAMEAAAHAELQWTRIQANMGLSAYEIYAAVGVKDELKWPEMPMNEILDIAFKNKIIDRPDHLVLRQLRGAA